MEILLVEGNILTPKHCSLYRRQGTPSLHITGLSGSSAAGQGCHGVGVDRRQIPSFWTSQQLGGGQLPGRRSTGALGASPGSRGITKPGACLLLGHPGVSSLGKHQMEGGALSPRLLPTFCWARRGSLAPPLWLSSYF